MSRMADDRRRIRLLDLQGVLPSDGVARLIAHALELNASDLFFTSNEQHVAVLVRRFGIIEPLSILDSDQGRRCMSHIRAEAGMDLSDHRRPRDGRWIYQTSGGANVDLRINVLPTLHGDDLALRLLVRDQSILSLDRIGMLPAQLQLYQSLLDRPGGLLLLTGPTGSGKTVTLYASLDYCDSSRRKIHTIEDPIEFDIEGLRQSQVNPAIELGAAELLRGVLRQAPDVVMLGEIRDVETAETAAWAANSGIMVLATIHGPTAAGAIQSLRGFGVAAPFISSSLRAALSQRLLRTVCPDCREPALEGRRARRALAEIDPLLDTNQGMTVYQARGCDRCYQSGYAGRTGIFEIMPVQGALREMILKGRSARQLRLQAEQDGMLTMRQVAMLKVAKGLSTLEEVERTMNEPAPGKSPQRGK